MRRGDWNLLARSRRETHSNNRPGFAEGLWPVAFQECTKRGPYFVKNVAVDDVEDFGMCN